MSACCCCFSFFSGGGAGGEEIEGIGVRCCFYLPYMPVLLKTLLKKSSRQCYRFSLSISISVIFPQLSYFSFFFCTLLLVNWSAVVIFWSLGVVQSKPRAHLVQ